MKTKRLRLLRLALILSVVMVAAGVTGETRSTKADPLTCEMAYAFQQFACGVPESCAYGDWECRMRNQPINDCHDRATNNYFACMGYAPVQSAY